MPWELAKVVEMLVVIKYRFEESNDQRTHTEP